MNNYKKLKLLSLTITTVFLTSCFNPKSQINNHIPEIDLSKNYPKKDLFYEDITNIKTIKLENVKNKPIHGYIFYYDDDIMMIRNKKGGEIFTFTSKGKFIKSFNKKGNGPEEYPEISDIAYDKENDELFINDIRRRKITVFDSNGKFKRSFQTLKNRTYMDIYIFKGELIAFDNRSRSKECFFVISKEDGSFKKNIGPKITKKIIPQISKSTGKHSSMSFSIGYNKIIHHNDNLILNDVSSDTIFEYSNGKKMTPILTKTPSVHSKKPYEISFLKLITKDYYIVMQFKLKLQYRDPNNPRSVYMENRQLAYDRKENKWYEVDLRYKNIVTDEYFFNGKNQIETKMDGKHIKLVPAVDLIEGLEEGTIKGNLKNFAKTLSDEDNPMLMILNTI
jgi:hypothetical protein